MNAIPLFQAGLSCWGVDPRIAAEDACKIEHDVSAESFEAIKRHINSVSK